jgi:hypothetical protein
MGHVEQVRPPGIGGIHGGEERLQVAIQVSGRNGAPAEFQQAVSRIPPGMHDSRRKGSATSGGHFDLAVSNLRA